jgi:NADH-quinone oxidoreductase subunit A
MASPVAIAGYLALFACAGFLFLFANLMIGWLIRPRNPVPEKLEIYECGEPTIGSSFVQFDLRFYVVALLFIIFDVEVAFFFPWATVFGKAVHLTRDTVSVAAATDLHRELGISTPVLPGPSAPELPRLSETAWQLGILSFVDILVFFLVLLMGFAYVWYRGDLNWVRALVEQPKARSIGSTEREDSSALVA